MEWPWIYSGSAAVPPPKGVQIAELYSETVATSDDDGTVARRWNRTGGEEVDRFVVKQKFFEGGITEKTNVFVGNEPDYPTTSSDLPVGNHMVRVRAVRNDAILVAETVPWKIREQRARVRRCSHPFRRVANLSITLPSEVTQVIVFDTLGREGSVPIDARRSEGTGSIPVPVAELRILGAGVYFFQI